MCTGLMPAQPALGITVGLIDPAHVLGQLPGHDHVVADHRLGAHVARGSASSKLVPVAQRLKLGMLNRSAYSGRIWSNNTISTRFGVFASLVL